MSSNLPKRLGKYELQERLGQGGMAEVWKVFDPQLKRYVAIKFDSRNIVRQANTRSQRAQRDCHCSHVQ